MLLATLALAWIGGIVATDVLALPDDTLLVGAIVGLASAVLMPRGVLRLVCLVLLVASLGGLRSEPVAQAREAVSVWRLVGQGEVVVAGVVEAEPKWTGDGQQVVLRTQRAWGEAGTGAIEGRILLVLPPYPAYHYGQHLLAMGKVREPPETRHPNLFDYRGYLARKRIFALMREPQVQVQPGRSGNPILIALLAFRTHCHTLILRGMPEPQASVASGMLLGLKATIPDKVYHTFSQNGITHVLVISGWHLSLVASLVTGMVRRLRTGAATTFAISIAAIWLYALFVGATGTVLRAALMASLVVLATATERQTEPWTLLLAACWFLTLWEPYILWDLGFQLSVLATAGIFAFRAPLHHWLGTLPLLRWSLIRGVTATLAVTLAAQITALPLILYHFGNLSLISPLSNILLTPLVPAIMLASAVALGVGLVAGVLQGVVIVGPIVDVLAWTGWLYAWLPLALLTTAAGGLAAIPGAAIFLPPFPLWLLFAYYAAAGGWGWWVARKSAHNGILEQEREENE